MTRDDAIRRIRSLIRLAESTTFPDEARAARRKAEYLMTKQQLVDLDLVVPPAPPPRPPIERPAPQGWVIVTTSTTNGFMPGQIFANGVVIVFERGFD